MEDNTLSWSLYEALESLGHTIETSMIDMFPVPDRYARPPFLRFRFKNVEKDASIYDAIKSTVKKFKGHLEWDMNTTEESKNYIIIPIFFEKYISEGNFYDKNYFISELDKEKYEKLIDYAINDVSFLSKKIREIGSNTKI